MRCWQSGLGLASQSWAVPAQCQVQRCCEPLSLLPGSSLDHGLWSRVPLHTSPGCHERRVKKGVPKGVTSCPETSMGHREPHSPAQELPFCRCLEKDGEALPGADPALHACCPLPASLYLSPSLPVPLHLQKQLQGLSLAVQAPAPQISLLLLPLCSSRQPGEGFDKYSPFHIGFPLPGAVLLRQWCFQQCQHCSNKVFTGSQLCQAPHTLGRVL